MHNAYVSFEQFLVVKCGLQPITIHGYMGTVRRARNVIGENPKHEDVINYIHVMYASTFSYSYKTNTALALEKWMEYLGNPLKLGRQKKPKRIIKDTLSEGEITKILFNCKNIREKTILSFLAYSGLRNKELCDFKVKDIDFASNSLRVLNGKGLKDSLCYISRDCIKTLIEYLASCPRGYDSYLFTTLRHGHRYNERDLRKLLNTVSKRAKITKRVYPHLLRHSLATNLLLRGANLLTVKGQLRHAWVTTTEIYIHSLEYATRNDYEQHAPSYN